MAVTDGTPGPAADALLAADSFLVREGRVRGLALHRSRFLAACADAGFAPDAVARFWDDAVTRLPAQGLGFPRFEASAAGLHLRLRPAPPLTRTVRLWVPDLPDPRSMPRRKGPDLAVLARWREEAIAHGADDAVLTGPDGTLREAAHSSLLWWDGGTLCLPGTGQPTLGSVTRALIVRQAMATGVPVERRAVRVADLAGAEVWAVNALHGIRPVLAWAGPGAGAVTPVPAGPASRAPRWRDWLDTQAEPVAGASAEVRSSAASGW